MNKFHVRISLAIITLCIDWCTSLDNGLALTPPMGWISLIPMGCNTDCRNDPDHCLSEKTVKTTADLMVSEGYKDLGYEYVIMDDCWLEKERTADGKLEANKERFPNGMKNLTDYIHSKGLKLGIYVDYAERTSSGYPGILGHLEGDGKTFVEWGIDYIKMDAYGTDPWMMNEGYSEFSRILSAADGRPVFLGCSHPFYQEAKGMKVNYYAVREKCNMWRQYENMIDSYSRFTDVMDHFASKQDYWSIYIGPGNWNDPDMLIIGNDGLNVDQAKAQMAVWAMLAAPLLMSTDLKHIRPEFKEILQNKKIIAVNQDKLGIQGRRSWRDEDIDVWTRPIEPTVEGDHSYAIAFISRREDILPHSFSTTLHKLGIPASEAGYRITVLLGPSGHKNMTYVLDSIDDSFDTKINRKGAVMLKAVPITRQTEEYCEWVCPSKCESSSNHNNDIVKA